MEKAHFFCGCLEAESFSLLLLDICLPVPVGASSEWERVGASAGPQPQLELLSLSKPGGTAGREQLARDDAPTVISAVRGGREAERQVGEEAALLLVADEVHTGGACDVHQDQDAFHCSTSVSRRRNPR